MRVAFYVEILQHSDDQQGPLGSLRSSSFTNGKPMIDAAVLKQKHKIVSSGLLNITPNLTLPLFNPYILIAGVLNIAVPTLGAPAFVQKVVPVIGVITNDMPVLGPAVLKQKNVLLKTDILARIPTIGAPPLTRNSVALWTPASLLAQPRAILDGETANWIGSALGDTVNLGTLGGTFIATTPGIVAKGAQLNGYDVFNFAGDCALGIAGLDWAAENVSIFAVASPLHDGAVHGIASMGFYNATTGWVFYTSIPASSLEGHTINANDLLLFGSGANATQNRIVAAPLPAGFGLMFNKIGTTDTIKHNGSVITPSYAVVGPNAAFTGARLNIGAGNAIGAIFEQFNGQIAYLLILADIDPLEVEKLEGWAAFKYGLQALLPVGHTYKTSPPLSSAVGVTVALTAAPMTNITFSYTTSFLNGKVNLSASSLTNVQPNLGVVGTIAGSPWTPNNLSVPPMVSLDGSNNAIWSGSNFVTSNNPGQLSGFIAATAGTPVKGVQLNGLDVIDLSAGQALGITGRNWPAANISIFAVVKPLHDGVIRGLASMGYYQPTAGWVFYTSMVATNLEGHVVNPNDLLIFGSGGNGTQTRVVTTPPAPKASGWSLIFDKVGSENISRQDGSGVTPSYTVTGPIPAMTNQRLNIGSGNSLNTVNEVFGGQIACLFVLTDPSQTEIEQLEGWAAWKYGLQVNLPVGHPYKSAPPFFIPGQMVARPPAVAVPTLGAPAFSATGGVVQPNNLGLNWTTIRDDNGTQATRPFQTWYAGQATAYRSPPKLDGPYAYGLPIGFSWWLGGASYIGGQEVSMAPGTIWNQLQNWFLFYPEAFNFDGYPGPGTRGGAAKPTVPHNILMRGMKCWIHKRAGGWITGADIDVVGVQPADYYADQRGGCSVFPGTCEYPVTVIPDPDNIYPHAYRFPGPPVRGTPDGGSAAVCIHGWSRSRSNFPQGACDGFWATFDVKVDQPGANMLVANGCDLWEAGNFGANTGHNTGPSQTKWVRLTQNWRTVTGTTLLTEAQLRADPPPPLVGGIPES